MARRGPPWLGRAEAILGFWDPENAISIEFNGSQYHRLDVSKILEPYSRSLRATHTYAPWTLIAEHAHTKTRQTATPEFQDKRPRPPLSTYRAPAHDTSGGAAIRHPRTARGGSRHTAGRQGDGPRWRQRRRSEAAARRRSEAAATRDDSGTRRQRRIEEAAAI